MRLLIKLRFPVSSLCYSLDPPEVHGNVIEATLTDSCPIMGPPLPPLFREEEFDVGPLPAGEYDVRFFESNETGRAFLQRGSRAAHRGHRRVLLRSLNGREADSGSVASGRKITPSGLSSQEAIALPLHLG